MKNGIGPTHGIITAAVNVAPTIKTAPWLPRFSLTFIAPIPGAANYQSRLGQAGSARHRSEHDNLRVEAVPLTACYALDVPLAQSAELVRCCNPTRQYVAEIAHRSLCLAWLLPIMGLPCFG